MRDVGHHGDYRIEKNLEVGPGIFLRMSGYGGRQMAACRRAHNAHLVGLYAPFGGVAAHKAHGLFGIRDGNVGVAMRHAVFKYDGCNAHVVEESSPVVPLMVHRQVLIAATRAYHHGTARCLFGRGQIDTHLGRVGSITVIAGRIALPQVEVKHLLCRKECRHRRHDDG